MFLLTFSKKILQWFFYEKMWWLLITQFLGDLSLIFSCSLPLDSISSFLFYFLWPTTDLKTETTEQRNNWKRWGVKHWQLRLNCLILKFESSDFLKNLIKVKKEKRRDWISYFYGINDTIEVLFTIKEIQSEQIQTTLPFPV